MLIDGVVVLYGVYYVEDVMGVCSEYKVLFGGYLY